MGERKVLNKYYPPDFDPSKLPKGKRVRSEEKQMKVRMMLPMSVRCNTCGTFMYKGTKFNTRMEDVKGETYLGIKIFRFYYRCTHCSAEFCMKTDPKTADYVVEAGATRNYEPWRDQEKAKVTAVAQREEEERGNAMKALENRTLDSKREMDILSALDEMKSLKARHAQIDTETALAALKRSAQQDELDLDAEDEEAVRRMLLQRAGFVRRLSDSDEEREAAAGRAGSAATAGAAAGAGPSAAAPGAGAQIGLSGGGAGDAPAAAAAGAEAGRRGKRKLGGVAGPSVAAAMWEDDNVEPEPDAAGSPAGLPVEQGSGVDLQQQQNGASGAATATAAAAAALAGRHNGGEAAAGPASGAAAGPSREPTSQPSAPVAGKPAAAAAAAKPSPLPGFAVKARPVAVVVKKKAAEAPGQQQQQAGGNSLPENEALGLLGGYGSGSPSNSD